MAKLGLTVGIFALTYVGAIVGAGEDIDGHDEGETPDWGYESAGFGVGDVEGAATVLGRKGDSVGDIGDSVGAGWGIFVGRGFGFAVFSEGLLSD